MWTGSISSTKLFSSPFCRDDLRNMSSHANNNFVKGQCKLILYQQNVKGGHRSHIQELTLCDQTAHKAHEFIFDYFKSSDKWDKNLFKAFFKEINEDWFELTKKDLHIMIYGMQVSGDRNVLYNENEDMNIKLIRKHQKIQLTTRNFFHGDNTRILTFNQIRQMKDPVVNSFFNCTSFSGLSICSTNLLVSRTLKKIDIN